MTDTTVPDLDDAPLDPTPQRIDAGIPATSAEAAAAIQATAENIRAAYASAMELIHPLVVLCLRGDALRDHRRHCRLCPSTPGHPRPLRVDGHEYRRRQRARKRRR